MTEEQWDVVSRYALSLFARGQARAAERGLILVDTKYEFGTDKGGRIVLGDEIHTPDSSRYWLAESYQESFAKGERPRSFDKDFIRAWVTARCDPYKDAIPEIPASSSSRPRTSMRKPMRRSPETPSFRIFPARRCSTASVAILNRTSPDVCGSFGIVSSSSTGRLTPPESGAPTG